MTITNTIIYPHNLVEKSKIKKEISNATFNKNINEFEGIYYLDAFILKGIPFFFVFNSFDTRICIYALVNQHQLDKYDNLSSYSRKELCFDVNCEITYLEKDKEEIEKMKSILRKLEIQDIDLLKYKPEIIIGWDFARLKNYYDPEFLTWIGDIVSKNHFKFNNDTFIKELERGRYFDTIEGKDEENIRLSLRYFNRFLLKQATALNHLNQKCSREFHFDNHPPYKNIDDKIVYLEAIKNQLNYLESDIKLERCVKLKELMDEHDILRVIDISNNMEDINLSHLSITSLKNLDLILNSII